MDLTGRSALSLDAKGRISIPARYRDDLADSDPERTVVTLTQHSTGCLLMYPQSTWLKEREKAIQLPEGKRWLRRLILGSAVQVELDSNGRLLIPSELRNAVGLTKEVMLVGMGEEFEIWDVTQLAIKEAEDRAQAKLIPQDYSL